MGRAIWTVGIIVGWVLCGIVALYLTRFTKRATHENVHDTNLRTAFFGGPLGLFLVLLVACVEVLMPVLDKATTLILDLPLKIAKLVGSK